VPWPNRAGSEPGRRIRPLLLLLLLELLVLLLGLVVGPCLLPLRCVCS
jgi:hypothetical protein